MQEIAVLAQNEQSSVALRRYAFEKMGMGEKELPSLEPKFLLLLLKRAQLRVEEDAVALGEEEGREWFEG